MLVRGAALAAMMLLAQSPRDPGGPVGVLIGIHRQGTDSNPGPGQVPLTAGSLRTVWLAVDDPSHPATIAPVEIPDLLLPRRTGFWRLGLLGTCAEDDFLDVNDKVLGASVDIADHLWSAPAGQRPRVTLDDTTEPPESPGSCVRHDMFCSIDRRTSIYWVWPDYVSAELGGRYDCGAHPDWDPGYTLRRLDDLTLSVGIGDAFGPRVEAEAARALAAAARKWEADPPRGQEGCTSEARFDPQMWHIERRPGGWYTEGWSNTLRICGYGIDFPIDGDLARLTGRRGSDAARWNTLHASMPQLTDAHFSPGATWVVATTTTEVLFFRASAPDRPVARLRLDDADSIVMVEWATGANVRRWAAEARRARDAGPVEPIVVR
jgi:hypothetical protein